MFGSNIKEKIVALSKNLTGNTAKIDNTRHDVKMLMDLMEILQISNAELVDKVAVLENRQATLRDGLKGLVAEPSTPPFVQISPDDLQSYECPLPGSIGLAKEDD